MVFSRGRMFSSSESILETIRADLINLYGEECDLSEVRITSRGDYEFLITIVLPEATSK